MKKFYTLLQCFLFVFLFLTNLKLKSQDCSLLTATFNTYESRCASTGSIKVFASGGSGSYKYKTVGPVNSNFTTSDSITGLSAGTYSVIITDIVSNCTFTQSGVIVGGSYQDPRFALSKTDVSCYQASNGRVMVTGEQFGRPPFVFSIVSPSPMGIGTSNNTGIFNNLSAGDYTIRLTDSCGGIQTRQITVNDYLWQIDSYNFNKSGCDSALGFIKVVDSKGNISTVSGIPGFMYGIVRQPGDTIWSSYPTLDFDLAGNTSFEVLAKDNCGIIKKASASLIIVPYVSAVVVSAKTCNSFTASISGTGNFFNPDFCLFDSANVLITCNSTGNFTYLPYGRYCIEVHDSCTGATVRKCFNSVPPSISINNSVSINNKTCTNFTASITGQNGLTNPNYCLYDSISNLLSCNSTGIFSNLAYGSYCISVKDGCRDTTITRCFTVKVPIPSVPTVIVPNYGSCAIFSINIAGINLTTPKYCLYDSTNTLIACNTTGFFGGLGLGKYCANVYDSCFDTSFVRCFIVGPPVIANDLSISISNKTCSTFTAKANTNNIKNALFCLYSNNVLLSCDSSGIFDNLAYGSYCIKAINDCPDTTFTRCFSASANLPSVNNAVSVINTTCTTFTVQIGGQQYVNNPNYCLYDSNGVLITCNSTGQFDNLLYGKYCMKIINVCYDTTIVRCFVVDPKAVKITVVANKSCSYNYAKFTISITTGATPFNIKIYNPKDSLFFNGNYSSTNIIVDSIAGTIGSDKYKIIVTDNCGTKDSVSIGATASYVNYSAYTVGKCPSGTFSNGSGDIRTSATTNMGALFVNIIKKDNVLLSPQLSANTVVGGMYTFQDLGPGTYILSYKANDACNIYNYDTVILSPYKYPGLSRSSAYQCDLNGFSLGAEVLNGVGPFTYEIIGSSPTTPSIITSPQSSSLFNVNNGTNYTLVRLRALDACGNATLGDASILPLANNKITNTFNCFQIATTLSVDTVFGSTYSWYKKDNANSADSTMLSSGSKVYIPQILPGDTGVYVCKLVVNGGCVNRYYTYHLDGSCTHALPVVLNKLSGKFLNDKKTLLNWELFSDGTIKNFLIQRKSTEGKFISIGTVKAGQSAGTSQYYFTDINAAEKNIYRIKIINEDNDYTYSNAISLNRYAPDNITVYPNPVDNTLNISIANPKRNPYLIRLITPLNQILQEFRVLPGTTNFQISRTKNMSKGMYVVQIINLDTNDQSVNRIMFR